MCINLFGCVDILMWFGMDSGCALKIQEDLLAWFSFF